MPCYDVRTEDPSQLEEGYAKEAYERGDFEAFYRNVTKRILEQWLCDALFARVPHEHCFKWWEIHKRKERIPEV